MPRIVIAGLGPGPRDLITVEVQKLLAGTQEVFAAHSALSAQLPEQVAVHAFDALYNEAAGTDDPNRLVADAVVEAVAASANTPDTLVFCVPGHPSVGQPVAKAIRDLAAQKGIEVKVLAGISFIEPVCEALGIDPVESGLQILDAASLAAPGRNAATENSAAGETEPFLFSPYSVPVDPAQFPVLQGLSPMLPVLLSGLYNARLAGACKTLLLERYPAEHSVTVVYSWTATGQSEPQTVTLGEWSTEQAEGTACLYLPPIEPLMLPRDFDSLVYVMGRLRGPGGCPWDREQTHDSIKHHLLEEAYEAVDAMDSGDPELLAEELGDLLLQVVFHSQLAVSAQEFTLSDVVGHIVSKLIRRHPHVFGDVQVSGAEHVLRNWEVIKAGERVAKAKAGRKFESGRAAEQGLEGTGLLLSVPRAMPSLERAQQLQVRAARVGFDWTDISGVFDKVREEVGELEAEESTEARTEELGDLFFSLVNLAQWMGINAEEALRRANDKFIHRFEGMETDIVGGGRSLRNMTVDEMDEVWQRVKRTMQS